MTLCFPDRRYRRYDKVVALCDYGISRYCRGKYFVNYWRHQKIARIREGLYICNMCALKESKGVDNPRWLVVPPKQVQKDTDHD